MENKKAFLFDTNFIIQNQSLNNVVERLKDKYEAYVTQISIDERIAQICREERDRFNKVLAIQRETASIAKIELKTSYEERKEYLRTGIYNKYKKLFGKKIIPFKSDGNMFSSMLMRSDEKLPPFISGKSDKGFKDTLLWLSVIEYFKNNKSEKEVVFVTDDNGFLNNISTLTEEFEKETGKHIEIKRNSFYAEISKQRLVIHNTNIDDASIDYDGLRNRIESVLYEVCFINNEDSFGNLYQVRSFELNKEIDAEYVKEILERLSHILAIHILENGIYACDAFKDNRLICNGSGRIPLKSLLKLRDLYLEFTTKYTKLNNQFYEAVASFFNEHNYSKIQMGEVGDLPF